MTTKRKKKTRSSRARGYVVVPKVFTGPRDCTWPTYEEARAMVRARGIKNRSHYWAWHKEHRIKFLPNRPDHAYARLGSWVGWNDFLGNGNSFEKVGPNVDDYLPFWEAARIVHTLGIKSHREWDAYCLVNQLPAGVASNPRAVYKDIWYKGVGWSEWLGLNVMSVVDVATGVEGNMLWCLVVRDGIGGGCFEVIKDTGSNVLRDSGVVYTVLGKWKYERELEGQLWDYLGQVSDIEDGVVRRANNVYDVVSGLNQFLLMVR